jgi:hypothetical protein
MKLKRRSGGVRLFSLLLFLPLASGLIALWLICTVALVVSLALTGCRDPGILRRKATLPESTWRWSDQAQTYRPPGAYYDPDTAVVVEDFDHT